jgi:hypothetical protein
MRRRGRPWQAVCRQAWVRRPSGGNHGHPDEAAGKPSAQCRPASVSGSRHRAVDAEGRALYATVCGPEMRQLGRFSIMSNQFGWRSYISRSSDGRPVAPAANSCTRQAPPRQRPASGDQDHRDRRGRVDSVSVSLDTPVSAEPHDAGVELMGSRRVRPPSRRGRGSRRAGHSWRAWRGWWEPAGHCSEPNEARIHPSDA